MLCADADVSTAGSKAEGLRFRRLCGWIGFRVGMPYGTPGVGSHYPTTNRSTGPRTVWDAYGFPALPRLKRRNGCSLKERGQQLSTGSRESISPVAFLDSG